MLAGRCQIHLRSAGKYKLKECPHHVTRARRGQYSSNRTTETTLRPLAFSRARVFFSSREASTNTSASQVQKMDKSPFLTLAFVLAFYQFACFFLFSLALAFEPLVWISPNRNLPEVVQVHQIRFQRTQDKDSLNPVSFSYGSFFLCASLSELAARGHEDKQTTESKNLEGNFLTSHVLWCFVVFILQAVPVVFLRAIDQNTGC